MYSVNQSQQSTRCIQSCGSLSITLNSSVGLCVTCSWHYGYILIFYTTLNLLNILLFWPLKKVMLMCQQTAEASHPIATESYHLPVEVMLVST